jgi:hypothetical protein
MQLLNWASQGPRTVVARVLLVSRPPPHGSVLIVKAEIPTKAQMVNDTTLDVDQGMTRTVLVDC